MSSPRANPLPPVTPKKRCAVYTRKSTDEGLDQEYNSLEAQRDAGLAFIASQRHEGWIAVVAVVVAVADGDPSSPVNYTKAGSPSATATTTAATPVATWIGPRCAA